METVLLASGALSAIMTASGGDMRKAVTFLQSSHQLSAGSPVTIGIVTDISGQVRLSNISSIDVRHQEPHTVSSTALTHCLLKLTRCHQIISNQNILTP